jgi:Tfp pilus assembly pilus retraction ATPase PilT
MNLQELLQQMVNKHASDLHVRSGGPPCLRIDGVLSPISESVMTSQEVEAMLDQVVSWSTALKTVRK